MSEKKLAIYDLSEGEVVFDIDRDDETIWTTQEQIAKLFGVDRTVVSRHLGNIFRDEELEEGRVCAKNARTAADGKKYLTKMYNLDAIISVGYRVNSKKATKFRVWATGVLKKYVVQGAAVNERRLRELPEGKVKEIEGTLRLVRRLMEKTELEEGEAKGVLEVIAKYGKTLEAIREFETAQDSGVSRISRASRDMVRMRKGLTIGEVVNLAENLREQTRGGAEFGEFKEGGREEFERELERLGTDESGGTLGEKAARLLYFVVNRKPFVDGNREIGALVFIYFLTVNDFHLASEGETKISDRALAAIVLLMAEGEESEAELVISVVTRLLEG